MPSGIAADVTTIDEALQAHVATRRARQERLEAAEKQLTAARMEEGQALASLSAASEIATRVSATVENCATQIAGLQGSIEALDASVAEVLPEGQDASLAAVETALREQAQARTARIELDAQIKQTTAQCQTMRTQLDEARQHLAALEQRSQAAVEALEAAQEGVTKARESLEAAAGAWPEVGDALRKDANVALVLRHRVDETQAQQAALVKSMGQLETRIEYLKADIEKAEALRLRLAELKQEYNVAADLAQMLGAAKFQTFVQQEALLTLAAHGSTRLEQLSAGRYKLQLDDKGAEFEVVDQWNADMARSVRTLSGGETFLASLALSLALAESLPGLAASRRVVLDSIFLDEGFGSLDAEALDRAADALDALRMDNRMVCIVTHLPELAQRLPARIVVTKTEAGSSVAIA
jgi:exonuclease SbcC